jgi:hypothetical protein
MKAQTGCRFQVIENTVRRRSALAWQCALLGRTVREMPVNGGFKRFCVILKSVPSPAQTKPAFLYPTAISSIPCSREFSSEFFRSKPRILQILPKIGKFRPTRRERRRDSREFAVNRFWQHDLRLTLSGSPGAPQGNGRECRARLWECTFPAWPEMPPIDTLRSHQNLNHSIVDTKTI